MVAFSESLRESNIDDWNYSKQHRFVDEIFRGEVPLPVMRRYLIQDYQFVDRFVALIGAAIASADLFSSRVRFAQFVAMITSDENTYFLRAFEALGVSPVEYQAPETTVPTRTFQELMAEAAQERNYSACLAVLCVAEWLYLDWADRPDAALPDGFVHREWIVLHNNDGFRGFVNWLRSELDRVGTTIDTHERERAASFFRRAVKCERDFFDHIYGDARCDGKA